MLVVEKTESGICCQCGKPATKAINGMKFCVQCGDSLLISIIGKCSKAVEDATVTVKIMPKCNWSKTNHL